MASVLDIVGSVGKVAAAFIPGVGPVLAGAEVVADIIGGDTGAKIKQGLGLVRDGLAAVGKTPLSPEQQFQLEQGKQTTQIELAKIDLQKERMPYDDQAGGREIIRTESQSEDPVVRQARPKMMVLLGKVSLLYSFAGVLLVTVCVLAKVETESLGLLIKLLLYQGGTMWVTFTASFTGYTVARSVDKKTANGLDVSDIMQSVANLGKKISR